MIVDTNDLNQAFDAYKNGKIMRKDMLRHICDHLIALETAVAGLTAMRAEIDGVFNGLHEISERLDNLDDEIDTKVAMAANHAVSLWQTMNNSSMPRPQPLTPAAVVEAKRRGRPPKQPQAEAGG